MIFASSASKAPTVEGSFAASGQEWASLSTAMWLSGSGARHPGMTPRFRVITLFFICFPARKGKAAPDGWLAGGARGQPSGAAVAAVTEGGHCSAAPKAINPTEVHRFRQGNLSRTLDFVLCLFLAWGHARPPRPSRSGAGTVRGPRGAVPVPTLGALLHQPYWLWLRCDACDHCVAVALVPFAGAPIRRPTCCAVTHVARSADGVGRAFNIRAGVIRR
jgi:hypothetical protein